jgi:hypothetical protein
MIMVALKIEIILFKYFFWDYVIQIPFNYDSHISSFQVE